MGIIPDTLTTCTTQSGIPSHQDDRPQSALTHQRADFYQVMMTYTTYQTYQQPSVPSLHPTMAVLQKHRIAGEEFRHEITSYLPIPLIEMDFNHQSS